MAGLYGIRVRRGDFVVEPRWGLSTDEMVAVRRLAVACESAGGQDLKVAPREVDSGPVPLQFVAFSSGHLVGYCGVDLGHDAELCGMVHPAQRSNGAGRALLDAAVAAAAAVGRETVLLICEDAYPAAIDWLRGRGATLDSTELRMVIDLGDDPAEVAAGGQTIELRPATSDDRPYLRRLLDDGFPGMDGRILDEMIDRVQAGGDESLIALDSGRPVGTLRLFHTPTRSMVYGLVIDPDLRGRGHGAAAMRAALSLLRDRGVTEVSLEVLPDNQAAVRLYRRLGFATSTTYRYMRLRTRP
ncbi:MAG: GNAT family N-acetyltransferase [Candidatus Dormibacteraeota bacterium]|nr:GNAT family N-acetyltransferase [Candidatus Dormibacteraeota bacterium]